MLLPMRIRPNSHHDYRPTPSRDAITSAIIASRWDVTEDRGVHSGMKRQGDLPTVNGRSTRSRQMQFRLDHTAQLL